MARFQGRMPDPEPEEEPKKCYDIDVDAEALTREEVTAMDAEKLPDPNKDIEAFMDEAWRRQEIRGAWETREAPPKPESHWKIPNARPEERFEGAVRGKYDWDNEDSQIRDAELNETKGGAEIMDYASSDGDKKFSVYITLEDIDHVSSEKMTLTLDETKRRARFQVDMPDGRRFFTVSDTLLKREVKNPKIIRKRGQDKVVLKFTKCEERTWGPCFENYHEIYPSAGGRTMAQDMRERMEARKDYEANMAANREAANRNR